MVEFWANFIRCCVLTGITKWAAGDPFARQSLLVKMRKVVKGVAPLVPCSSSVTHNDLFFVATPSASEDGQCSRCNNRAHVERPQSLGWRRAASNCLQISPPPPPPLSLMAISSTTSDEVWLKGHRIRRTRRRRRRAKVVVLGTRASWRALERRLADTYFTDRSLTYCPVPHGTLLRSTAEEFSSQRRLRWPAGELIWQELTIFTESTGLAGLSITAIWKEDNQRGD